MNEMKYTVAAELKDLLAENVIKQDRVNDLEKALRDVLRQLEKAINGNAMDGDWIAAELHGRECLYSQAQHVKKIEESNG